MGFTHLLLTMILRDGFHYYLRFMDEETEEQGSSATCFRLPNKQQSMNWNLGGLAPVQELEGHSYHLLNGEVVGAT